MAIRARNQRTVVTLLALVMLASVMVPSRANALFERARREAGYQFGVFTTACATAAKTYSETVGVEAFRVRRAAGTFAFTVLTGETARLSMWMFTGE